MRLVPWLNRETNSGPLITDIYPTLLARVPDDFDNVSDIDLVDNHVSIHGSLRKTPVMVKASLIDKILD